MIEVGDVVKFNRVSSKYEYSLVSETKRKNKTDYIGSDGTVTSVTYADDELANAVIDVLFNDGQKWCFEKEQLQVVIPIHDVRDKLSRNVICIETGEIFESARKASKSIKVTPQAVRIACRTGGRLKGKHWKYTKGEKEL